jgi:hypothetical protein
MPLSERIVVDPEILAGKPVIRGTRPVRERNPGKLSRADARGYSRLLIVRQLLGTRIQGLSNSSVDASSR